MEKIIKMAFLKKKRISTIAFVSFTDIIFLLLVFILITSNFINNSQIKVSLPKASSKEVVNDEKIIVSIDKNLKCYYNNDEIKFEDLKSLLIKEKTKEKLIISADKTVAIDYVIKIIDMAKISGFKSFFIATENNLIDE